jgi:hypothetical protein
LLYWAFLCSCAGPGLPEWKVQWDPDWKASIVDSAVILRPVPIYQNLGGDTACTDCALSLSALAMEHDGGVDSLLVPWLPKGQMCDSICLEERGLGGLREQEKLWKVLVPQTWKEKWLRSTASREGLAWQEELSSEQKRILAYLRVQGQGDLMALSLVDSIQILERQGGGGVQLGAQGQVQNASKGTLKGRVEVLWWWTLWDLKGERLLLSTWYLGTHSHQQTGDIDRAWHDPARKTLGPALREAWDKPQQEVR